MPGLISVAEFIEETRQDVNSPTTSTFVSRMPQCRQTLATLEESLDVDRDGLIKMKKAVKAVNLSGTTHTENELYLSRALEGLGSICSPGTGKDYDPHIVAAYIKFSVVTKELSALMRTLMQNLSNIVLFPVDSLLKGDLRGVRGDLKRPFDKTWKDYEAKYSKLEKEKKAQAKEAGLLRTEVTPAEVAEEMDKERKMFQLQMCEYLIKVNEIKTKKGVELLQHLVEYYHAQQNYFQDGLKTIEHFGSYVSDLAVHLQSIRQKQDEERKQLIEMRNLLKSSPGLEKEWNANMNAAQNAPATGYSLHQLQGNKQHGLVKIGFLLKKSEGKMRKVWQKRRCEVRDGFLSIYHADESKAPNRVNLLTCQIKPVQEDKKCFDVISYNRTYHFQVEEESDLPSWVSVLSNSKEGALQKAFNDNGKLGPKVDQALIELQNVIVKYIRRLPSNDRCADCYSQNDPTWLSTNFGIIVCIECSGVHRDMGVHISRIQSLDLDHVPTSQLLIARHMSNHSFNEVMEETLHEGKPSVHSSMEKRIEFIRAKYIEKKFAVKRSSDPRYLQGEMEDAIENGDLLQLLHAFVDGADFSAPFFDNDVNETALHMAIRLEQGQTLHLVDFMVENTSCLDTANKDGDTPLHYCVRFNQPEAMKLLLRSGANIYIENKSHKTPFDLAKELVALECEELLNLATQNKKSRFDNINVEWNLLQDDAGSSDDEFTTTANMEETAESKGRSRPPSLVMGIGGNTGGRDSPTLNSNSRSRSSTSESLSVTESSPSSVTGRSGVPPPTSSRPRSSASAVSIAFTTSATTQLGSKKRAPLPPVGKTTFRPGHSRHASDVSVGSSTRGLPITVQPSRTSSHSPASLLAGAKLVIPKGEPPILKSVTTSNGGGSRPRGPPPPAPCASHSSSSHAGSGLLNLSNGRSIESLASAVSDVDSVGHGSHHYRSEFRPRRCRALYDCVADNEDELPFNEGDILVVTVEQTEDENWMEGYLEHNPRIKGVFPASFVYMLND